MLEQRALFIFHERNQAAIEELHRSENDGDHEDIQVRFRQALSNEELPAETRVRMACAIGAVMGALAFSGDVFSSLPSDELGAMLRRAVATLLVDPAPRATGLRPVAQEPRTPASQEAGHPDAVVESGRVRSGRPRNATATSHSTTRDPGDADQEQHQEPRIRSGPVAGHRMGEHARSEDRLAGARRAPPGWAPRWSDGWRPPPRTPAGSVRAGPRRRP